MLQDFQNHIKTTFPFLTGKRLLIAISGGLDSVVLTHFCNNLDLDISLAHCNFNLRGTESDADEEFVVRLANHLNLEIFVQHFTTQDYAEKNNVSIQMAARELRYDWFYDLAKALEFDYILTAHHADDNLETVLINLTRGTGITGLTGIPEVNGKLIRPLLPFSRAALEQFAEKKGLLWREDSSNTSDKYLRNKIRHQIIPVLKEINPELLHNFKITTDNLKDTADIVEESLNAVAKRAIVDLNEDYIKFKISEFKKVNNPKAYLYEMFKDYGFTEWGNMVALLDAQSGKQLFSNTHRLLKDREHLILSKSNDSDVVKIALSGIEALDCPVNIPNGRLRFTEVNKMENTDANTIYMDKNKLKFPLNIRKWFSGDFFYPLGMKGTKKLSKYFKDKKLSLIDKEQVLLLCSQDDIVWVVGMRADERFKVDARTEAIIKVEFLNT